MNPGKKAAILLKLRLIGLNASGHFEGDPVEAFEEFYAKRIEEKEKIIDALREIEIKLEEKKILDNSENTLITLLKDRIFYSMAMQELLNFNSLN